MMMLNVPATVGLIVLAHADRPSDLRASAFLPSDTAATAAALQFYAVGLLGYSVVRIASPTFYALGDSRTPVKVSVATVLVNAVAERRAGARARLRGLALGHVDRGAVQRGDLARAAAAELRRSRRPRGWPASFARIARCVGGDGRRGVAGRPGVDVCRCRELASSSSCCDWRRRSARRWSCWRYRARLLRIREFDEAFALVAQRFPARAMKRAAPRPASDRPRPRQPRTSWSTASATSSRRCCRCSFRS